MRTVQGRQRTTTYLSGVGKYATYHLASFEQAHEEQKNESHTSAPGADGWRLAELQALPVSHSMTEAEDISFEAGLQLQELPALILWECVVAVLSRARCESSAHPFQHIATPFH